jgi:hypothetical protein
MGKSEETRKPCIYAVSLDFETSGNAGKKGKSPPERSALPS